MFVYVKCTLMRCVCIRGVNKGLHSPLFNLYSLQHCKGGIFYVQKKSVLYSTIKVNLRGIQLGNHNNKKTHPFSMKQNMFWGSTLPNIVKVVMILELLLCNIKALEAARPPLDFTKPKLGKIKGSVSSKDRAPEQSSSPNPCTYIPGHNSGDSGCHNP